jgi:3-hydroxybutyryl-CoA dehydratase
MDMPGPGSVFVRQTWNFPSPVYIGDTITAQATVKSVRPSRNMAELEFEVLNQDGLVVLKGDALVFQDDGSA